MSGTSAARPRATLVALDHLVDETGLRDGDEDEEEGHRRHRGQVEVVAGDDLRLVEGVDGADDVDQRRVLLQRDEVVEQRRDDAAARLRDDDVAQRLGEGEAQRAGGRGLAPVDAVDAGPVDLGHVGAVGQGQGQDGVPLGRELLDHRQAGERQAEADEVDADDRRQAAEDVGVDGGDGPDRLAGRAGDESRDGDDEAPGQDQDLGDREDVDVGPERAQHEAERAPHQRQEEEGEADRAVVGDDERGDGDDQEDGRRVADRYPGGGAGRGAAHARGDEVARQGRARLAGGAQGERGRDEEEERGGAEGVEGDVDRGRLDLAAGQGVAYRADHPEGGGGRKQSHRQRGERQASRRGRDRGRPLADLARRVAREDAAPDRRRRRLRFGGHGFQYGILVGSLPQAAARYLAASFLVVPSLTSSSITLLIAASLAEPLGNRAPYFSPVWYWPGTTNRPCDSEAWPRTIAVSVIATSTWPAWRAVNMEGVSGNTLPGFDGLSVWSVKSPAVVACCTPMRADFIDCSSIFEPFFASTPMSESK